MAIEEQSWHREQWHQSAHENDPGIVSSDVLYTILSDTTFEIPSTPRSRPSAAAFAGNVATVAARFQRHADQELHHQYVQTTPRPSSRRTTRLSPRLARSALASLGLLSLWRVLGGGVSRLCWYDRRFRPGTFTTTFTAPDDAGDYFIGEVLLVPVWFIPNKVGRFGTNELSEVGGPGAAFEVIVSPPAFRGRRPPRQRGDG